MKYTKILSAFTVSALFLGAVGSAFADDTVATGRHGGGISPLEGPVTHPYRHPQTSTGKGAGARAINPNYGPNSPRGTLPLLPNSGISPTTGGGRINNPTYTPPNGSTGGSRGAGTNNPFIN